MLTDVSTDVRRILTEARTIAVLGASEQPDKPGHYVPAYLHSHGYRVIAVSPRLSGKALWGEQAHGSLTELRESVDIVDVFRRAEDIGMHVPEILAMQPRPKVVWFQLGIRNDEAAKQLRAAGIEVVQDRCTMADHRRLLQ